MGQNQDDELGSVMAAAPWPARLIHDHTMIRGSRMLLQDDQSSPPPTSRASPGHDHATGAAAATHAGPSAAAIAVGFVISMGIALACLLFRKVMSFPVDSDHDYARDDDLSTNMNSMEKGSPGLEKSLLDKIKVSTFARKARHVHTHECAVCLASFDGHDSIRVLPHCKHTFHVACIDEWFTLHATCPICRNDMVALCSTLSSFNQSRSFSINNSTQGQYADVSQGFDGKSVTKSLMMLSSLGSNPSKSYPPCDTKAHDQTLDRRSPDARELASSSSGKMDTLSSFNTISSNKLYRNSLKKSFSAEWDASSHPCTQYYNLLKIVESHSTSNSAHTLDVRFSSVEEGQDKEIASHKVFNQRSRYPRAKSIGSLISLRSKGLKYCM